MEIKCEKTATTGVQIFVDGEYLTTFRYFPECDNFIELIENAQKYKNKCAKAENNPTSQEQLAAPAVVGQSEQLNCDHEWKCDTFDCYGFPVEKYCEKCGKKEAI